MTKEVRVLFLTALTLAVYAVSIYLNQGALIFPFPLNELILLVVAIQFAFWHHKNRIPILYILGISLFGFLGNEVYWSFILVDQKMYTFSALPITDIFKLLSALCIVGFCVYTLLAQKNLMARFCSIIFIVMYISSITYLPSYFSFYGLILMTVGLFIQSVHRPFHLFWMLLLLLESTKYLTLLLNN
ncbi:MAG: hypothetical protein QNL61_11305 [Crocinitomicaceae bacterium]